MTSLCLWLISKRIKKQKQIFTEIIDPFINEGQNFPAFFSLPSVHALASSGDEFLDKLIDFSWDGSLTDLGKPEDSEES